MLLSLLTSEEEVNYFAFLFFFFLTIWFCIIFAAWFHLDDSCTLHILSADKSTETSGLLNIVLSYMLSKVV